MPESAERQEWLRVLANATANDISQIAEFTGGDFTMLRAPEIGLAMVAGRVGATGQPFGLGEMTLTRCVVQVDDAVGVGYVRGRSPEHAQSVAIIDALLQGPRHDELMAAVVTPLATTQSRRRGERAAAVDTSRVQFLTMVRGD